MTEDSTAGSGRVARLKAGLNLNNALGLGAKPPIGFKPVLPPGVTAKAELHVDTAPHSPISHMEVTKKPPPPPVSPKPRAPETKKAEVANAKDADALDGPAASGPVSVSKLREKLQIAIPTFNPAAHHAADTVDSASRSGANAHASEVDSPKAENQNGGIVRHSSSREERTTTAFYAFPSKPSPVHMMINPASLVPGGAKRKTPSENTEGTEEHRPLESLTKGRPKMARRRAPTSASTNVGKAAVETPTLDSNVTTSANGNVRIEADVVVLSARVKAIAVSEEIVEEECRKVQSLVEVRSGEQSSPRNSAMEVDESSEETAEKRKRKRKQKQQQQLEHAEHSDSEQLNTRPSNGSDGTVSNQSSDSTEDTEYTEL